MLVMKRHSPNFAGKPRRAGDVIRESELAPGKVKLLIEWGWLEAKDSPEQPVSAPVAKRRPGRPRKHPVPEA